MKKYLLIVLLAIIVLTGCERNKEKIGHGEYKEGTYFGSTEYILNDQKYVATAVIYVNENGFIKSCFIDSGYIRGKIATTKKSLGDDLGMKSSSNSNGIIKGGSEWYQEIEILEQKIIDEQGTSIFAYKDNSKQYLDGVTGVTIKVNPYVKAVDEALKQAK